jgi:hypothetical protein
MHANALVELRRTWHAGAPPLTLLSGARGTAFQARFVKEQLDLYSTTFSSGFPEHYDPTGFMVNASAICSEWASILIVSVLARRGSWDQCLTSPANKFCSIQPSNPYSLPSPFDPGHTKHDIVTAASPSLQRLVHFASFNFFLSAFIDVSHVTNTLIIMLYAKAHAQHHKARPHGLDIQPTTAPKSLTSAPIDSNAPTRPKPTLRIKAPPPKVCWIYLPYWFYLNLT